MGRKNSEFFSELLIPESCSRLRTFVFIRESCSRLRSFVFHVDVKLGPQEKLFVLTIFSGFIELCRTA